MCVCVCVCVFVRMHSRIETVLLFAVFERQINAVTVWCCLTILLIFLLIEFFAGETLVLRDIFYSSIFGMDTGYLLLQAYNHLFD